MNDPATGALDAHWRRLVADDPGRTVLRAADADLPRAEFEALIEAECHQLARHGIARGDIVAWLGINTPRMLALLFACARLRAVLLPLNWRLAAEELQAVCRHAGAGLLLSSADQHALAAQIEGAVARERPAPLIDALPGQEPLLLVYTSGTTGRPKGALHTQAQLMANARAAIAVQGLDGHTRTLTVLPMFHVGGLCIQTLPTLVAGGQVALHGRFDAAAWVADVEHWRPTTSLLVPAAMRAIVERADFAAADLSSLRAVYCGSSVVPPALIEAFHARGVPMAQVYGSTETGPFSIAQRPEEAMTHVGQVGTPAPGVQVRLVAPDGTDVADGAVGEIWLRGDNLMQGYHREPPSAAFRDGWFRSGDLARRLPDGHYQVVGRSKDMIISGGENIYPAEIENLVGTWPGVAECAVVGLPDERWGEVPVLAVVAQPGATLRADELAAGFAGRLARYKHPRRIVVLDHLPRTALGKVQAAALRRRLQAEAGD